MQRRPRGRGHGREAARLEETYTQHVLAELIQAGGVAGGETQPPAKLAMEDA